MFQKVFQALISSDMNVNLWFSFPLWIVMFRTSRPEHSLFIYCSPKIYCEWWWVFKLFVFFLDLLQIYSQKKLCLDYLFFIEIWTERALLQKTAFLHVTSRTVWNCFVTPNFLSQIIACIRNIKPSSLSFIISTFISSSLPFT